MVVHWISHLLRHLFGTLTCIAIVATCASAQEAVDRPELAEAQRMFYSGNYQAAAALALSVRSAHPDNLDSYETRTSALHFEIRRQMRDAAGHPVPFKQCDRCADLLKEFLDETAKGQAVAH